MPAVRRGCLGSRVSPVHTGNHHAVLFVSPDASRSGAPLALLRLLGWIKRQTDLQFRVLLYQDGPLAPEFAALAPTVTLTEVGVGRSGLVRRIGKLPGIGALLKRIWFRTIAPRVIEQRPGIDLRQFSSIGAVAPPGGAAGRATRGACSRVGVCNPSGGRSAGYDHH